MARLKQGGEGRMLGRRTELTASRSSGEEFPVELAITPSSDASGEIFVGYLRDITEQKEADRQRVLLEAQLRQAQKMEAIGHLTGGIAHDFNNLLTALTGYVVMAEEQLRARGDTQLAGYLEKAGQSGNKARDLIQQMLTFSRGQRGDPKAVILSSLLNDCLDLLSSSLPSSIDFHANLHHPVPAMLLDPVQMEQIAMNLCINARDAVGEHGRVELTVRECELRDQVCTSCQQAFSGRFVEMVVQDDGEGIAPEVLERIFEPFYSTKAQGRGSGMGLSTIHGIVHDYEGHIVVDSLPGLGANFRVLLPYRPISHDQLTANHLPASNRADSCVLSGHVLVVDDMPAVKEFLQDMLESWQLQVSAFDHPREALAAYRANPQQFDLAILDHTMPEMTGLDLADCLLQQRPELPVILYTGYAGKLTEEEVQAHGVRALVRKPVDVPGMQTLIADLLQLSRRRAS
jgi:signal transduction histidine kinase